VTAPYPEVNDGFSCKWELPANILERRKLLSGKKFVIAYSMLFSGVVWVADF